MNVKVFRSKTLVLVFLSFGLQGTSVFGEDKPAFVNEYASYTPSEYSKEKVVVEWNSKEGLHFLSKSKYIHDFYQLAPYYQPQINPAYCGMASLTILSNYFRMRIPGVPSNPDIELMVNQPEGKTVKMGFQGFSQLTFFKHPGVTEIKSEERVRGANKEPPFGPGVNLDEFVAMLKAYNFNGEAVHVDKSLKETTSEFDKFIETLKKSTTDDHSVVVANFRGKLYGGVTGGHISPIVGLAWDEARHDYRVLILDVAAHRNPWAWVPAKDFYYAMNSGDKTPNGEKFRGYVVVSENR